MDYAIKFIQGAGVAIVPGRGFFHQAIETKAQPREESPKIGGKLSIVQEYVSGVPMKCSENYTTRYIRIAFCKDMTTLKAANIAIMKHLTSMES